MKSRHIRLCVILLSFVYFGYAEGSCRFYEEELAVNQTWESCKALCAQKNGSCLTWAHNLETNRCAGWMLESQSETRKNDKGSSDDSKDTEGSVAAADKKEGDSEDDAKASGPSHEDSFFDFEDDQESTAENYYASFYNTPARSGDGESDDDDGSSSGYASFDGYDYSYTVPATSGDDDDSVDVDAETTAQDYYNAFYNVPTRSGETEDGDDDGSTMMYEYIPHYDYGSPGSISSDYVNNTSNSTSSDLPSNTTSRALKEQKSDPPIHALVEKYRSLNRGPLYDQCEVIATVSFITPVNSVSSTMSGCFFQKLELINSTTKEQCNAVCQNMHSSANASCIAWMWGAEEQNCLGIALTLDSNYSFCGLP